eukprot:PITA_01413
MGNDEILQMYVSVFERSNVLVDAHGGTAGGHYAGRETMEKILRTGLWWPTLHHDSKAYCKACDVCQRTVLSAYQATCKKLIGQTPFRLVYGVEALMPMEYIVPSLCISALIGTTNRGALEERLAQLDELEEEQFLARFHEQVQKQREKAWHD